MKRKLGLSPVVAEILVILIVVSGSIAVYSWMHSTASTDPTQEATNSKIVIKGVSIDVDNATATLYLQNLGDEPTSVSTIYLLAPNGTILSKWDVNVKLEPGATYTVSISLPSLPPLDGYTFKVLGASTAPYVFSLAEKIQACPPPGWSYYRVINITNPTTTSVSGFPVRIVLNTSNFDFSKARSDGGDLRFYTDDCKTEAYYWIEQWNPSLGHAIVWVRLPSLPAGDTVQVVMTYGNPTATFDSTYMNASKLFLFYDDAETFTGWTVHGDGNVYQSNDLAFEGSYSLKKTDNCDPNGATKDIGVEIGSTPFALEFYVYRVGSDLTCAYDNIDILDADGNGYAIHIGHGSSSERPDVGIDKRVGYRVVAHTSGSLTYDPLDQWVLARLVWLANGTMKAYLYALDGTLLGQSTYTDSSYNRFTQVAILGGVTYYVDAMKIAPLLPDPANTTPIVEVGEEKTG